MDKIRFTCLFIYPLFFLCFIDLYPQNLILDPGFEFQDSLQTWTYVNSNKPRFISSSRSDAWKIPSSASRAQGNGYVNLHLHTNDREFIQTRLSETLQRNEIYCIEAFVLFDNFSFFTHYTEGLGYHLSKKRLQGNEEIVAGKMSGKLSSIFSMTDSVNWIRICSEYQASSDEEWLTIGGFRDIKYYRIQNGNPDTISNIMLTAYFVDNISVQRKKKEIGCNCSHSEKTYIIR